MDWCKYIRSTIVYRTLVTTLKDKETKKQQISSNVNSKSIVINSMSTNDTIWTLIQINVDENTKNNMPVTGNL